MNAGMYPELAKAEDAYHRERLQSIFHREGRKPRRRNPVPPAAAA